MTDKLIQAAEKYAELYDDDPRQDIKIDVMNAFFSGWKFALAEAKQAAPTIKATAIPLTEAQRNSLCVTNDVHIPGACHPPVSEPAEQQGEPVASIRYPDEIMWLVAEPPSGWITCYTHQQVKAEPLTEWQPIETAPKDASVFLAYRGGQVREMKILVRPDGELWTFGGHSWFPSVFPERHLPTHWRPQLALPSAHGIGVQQEGE